LVYLDTKRFISLQRYNIGIYACKTSVKFESLSVNVSMFSKSSHEISCFSHELVWSVCILHARHLRHSLSKLQLASFCHNSHTSAFEARRRILFLSTNQQTQGTEALHNIQKIMVLVHFIVYLS